MSGGKESFQFSCKGKERNVVIMERKGERFFFFLRWKNYCLVFMLKEKSE